MWVNPEVDQGFGLSNTLGVAGFTSGEAYKVGAASPYVQLPRLFVRQTINLGGEETHVEAGLNQLASTQTANRVVVTVGMPAFVYRWYFRAHSLRSLERNILRFVGIAPVRQTLIGSVETCGARRHAQWLCELHALGRSAK